MLGGHPVPQEPSSCGFSLERHVPARHLLRSVDLAGAREHLGPFYSTTGRPSIDPELLLRMSIVGSCLRIRSERRLCDEFHLAATAQNLRKLAKLIPLQAPAAA